MIAEKPWTAVDSVNGRRPHLAGIGAQAERPRNAIEGRFA
jgi:hypothetical protein